MVGLLVTLLVCLGAVGYGRFLVGRWTASLDVVAQLGLHGLAGLGTLGLLTFGLGHLPQGLHWGIGVVGLVTVGGLVLFAKELSRIPKPVKPESLELLFPVAIAAALFMGMVGVLTPSDSNDWDSLAYHLAVPKLWLASGHMDSISFIHHSNFPATVDGLYVWGLTYGGQAGAKAFSLAFACLSVLIAFGLARGRYGAKAAWWSALAVSTLPVVLWESGTAYVDLANGLFGAAGILLAMLYLEDQKDSGPLWLSAIFLGFCAGSKYNGLMTIGVVALVLLVASRDVKRAVLLGVIASAIAAPWYVRNVINTGNPVYPYFYSKLGGKGWAPWNAEIYSNEQQSFGVGRSAPGQPLESARLGASALGLAYQPGRYVNPGQDRGLGAPFAATGCIPLVALALWGLSGRSRRFETGVIAVALLTLVAWFFLSQQSRYLLTILWPLAFLAGGAVVRLALGQVVAGLVVVQSLASFAVLQTYIVAPKLQVLAGKVSPEDYQKATIGFYEPAQYLNQNLKPSDKVALYDEVFGFLLDVPYYWANPGHTTELGYEKMATADDLIASLKSHGFTHVYFNAGQGLGDPTEFGYWFSLAGLRPFDGPPVYQRADRFGDLGQRYKILLAEAIKAHKLELVQAFGSKRLLFKVGI